MAKNELDMIIPISLDLDWPTVEEVIACIREQWERYGFTRFMLACPCAGWRMESFPPISYFEEKAAMFHAVASALQPLGISCGWWITATLKSGITDDTVRPKRADGTESQFATCPLDEVYTDRFCRSVARFAKLAHPAFIITEDDYSVYATTFSQGCFCRLHMAEFARREGKAYTREELCEQFQKQDTDSLALLRRFRDLSRDSLVKFAKALRAAVDEATPEIPIGYMQPGGSAMDGNSVFAVSQALAGPRHIPFSRLCGTFYGEADVKRIPSVLFEPLYYKQHGPQKFCYYHEADTFPHTRFFKSGREMKALMGNVYCYGFDGSTFQTQQLLDDPNEEAAFGAMFAHERKRFTAANAVARRCTVKGVEVDYDPFGNTVDLDTYGQPQWLDAISAFGIPYTSRESDVVFWDAFNAQYAADEQIRRVLGKTVFLDGEAARILVARGYERYLGAKIGKNPVAGTRHQFDLGEREVLCDGIAAASRGRHMPPAHLISGHSIGQLLSVIPTHPDTRVLTGEYTFRHDYLCDAMTRFENELGGTVIIMGITLKHNRSQSLLNYRRQRLIQELLTTKTDTVAFVREQPRVFLVMNEANAGEDFIGMLTLTNLGCDPAEGVRIHLPQSFQGKTYRQLTIDGEWIPLNCTVTEDGITLTAPLEYLEPVYLLIQ